MSTHQKINTMKYGAIYLLPFVLLASYTSCKKDYVCSCISVNSVSIDTININIENVKELEAQKICSRYEGFGSQFLPPLYNCSIQ
jgi:hypothetical protein